MNNRCDCKAIKKSSECEKECKELEKKATTGANENGENLGLAVCPGGYDFQGCHCIHDTGCPTGQWCLNGICGGNAY